MRTLREWIRRALGAGRRDDDLAEELRLHAELAAEAGRPARVRAGGSLQAMDALRDQRGLPWLDDFTRDVRHALRSMRRSPGFTAVALITLALGIGANAAVFTVADAVVLKALPVREPERLMLLGDPRHGGGVTVGQLGQSFELYSYELYRHLRDANVLDGLSAVQSEAGVIGVRRHGWETSRSARARLVSGNYFQLLGLNARLGRTIVPDDEAPSAPPVAVISFEYWRDTLNADPSVIGETLDVNGVPVSIVGVAPPEFFGETREPDPPRFWLPIPAMRALQLEGNLVDAPAVHWLYLLGRVPPGMTTTQAEVRLTAALQSWLRGRLGDSREDQLQERIAASRVQLTSARGGVPHLRYSHSGMLGVLLGISAAVLLLACANIAGLLLARGMARHAERSMRLALGASRGRLVRQSLTESLTLGLAGGGVALVAGAAAARLLVTLVFVDAEHVPIPTAPDARVLLFTFALSCAAAALFGILPALRVRRDIAASIKTTRFRAGKVLVIGQVALSLVMLAVAGSLTYSLVQVARQPFGFNPRNVLVVDVDPRLARYEYGRLAALYQQIESRLSALPGVTSAALSYYSPFNGCCWHFSITVPGYVVARDESTETMLNRVSSRYFDTIGTRRLRGRVFDDRDTPLSQRVAVVNEAFARRYFASEDPIGRTFVVDSEPGVNLEIVGVVEDAKYDTPGNAMEPMAFLPFLQRQQDGPTASGDYHSNFIGTIEVRTAGEPGAIARSARGVLTEIDPDLPVLRVGTVTDHIDRGMSIERAVTILAAVFAALALLLTCVGLYGVMAYLVQRRTAEIGVRVALGAARASVISLMMRDTLVQAVAGVVLGLPLAYAATQSIGMHGIPPASGTALAAGTVLLVICLALAGYVPARRASRLDPNVVLRAE